MNTKHLLPIVFAIASFSSAFGARFNVVSAESEVVFESKAKKESFEGRTRKVEGHVEVDPAALGNRIDFSIQVDLASLDTGMSLRNAHMRANHLETDKFPHVKFTGGKVQKASGTSLAAGALTFELEGEFDLHGVTRTISVPVEAQMDGGALRIKAKFPVSLSDHEIPRPQFLFLKLGETQKIRVELTLRPEA